MTGTPRLLMVQNDSGSGAGQIPEWADAAGVGVHVLPAFDGAPVPTSPAGWDGVVLLGGGLLPDQDDDAPWLVAERELALACVREATPLLGICLGGQLLAHVLGGEVRGRYGLPEKGATRLDVLPEAADDLLLGGLGPRVVAMESHRDQITRLPDDVVLLASSPACRHQAFRCGESAWGLQFHPEIPGSRATQWSADQLREDGFDPAQVAADGLAAADELEQTWSAAVHRFLDLVATQARR